MLMALVNESEVLKLKLIYAHPHKSLFCAALLSASILTLFSSLEK